MARVEQAVEASARAIAYRRAQVDRELRTIIRTSKLAVLITDAHMERTVLSESGRVGARMRLDLDAGTIDLVQEGPRFVFDCDVEASELVDLLTARSSDKGRRPTHDWLLFERLCRELLESEGLPARQDDYVRRSLSTYANVTSDSEPAISSARERFATLLPEYGDSEN